MNEDYANPVPPYRRPRPHQHKWGWLGGGMGLILLGVLLLPTVVLTAIGIGAIVLGGMLMFVGGMRLLRAASVRAVNGKFVR